MLNANAKLGPTISTTSAYMLVIVLKVCTALVNTWYFILGMKHLILSVEETDLPSLLSQKS